jgi:hypothetical protein
LGSLLASNFFDRAMVFSSACSGIIGAPKAGRKRADRRSVFRWPLRG